MNRIYDGSPGKGELQIRGRRVCLHTGHELLCVTRVEFDNDTDRGIATVSFCPTTAKGPDGRPSFVLGLYKGNELVTCSFRAWVQVVAPGEKPTVSPADGLVDNPMRNAPGAEPFVLFSELETMAAGMREMATK